MAAADYAEELGTQRRRELRRFLVVSALAHVLAVAAMAFAPSGPTSALAPRGIVEVELLDPSALARPEPPPAEPAPEPPKPIPPPPVVKPTPPKPVDKVVLPEEPTAPRPKPKPKPAPPPAPPPQQPEQVDYEDFLETLRAERGEPPAAAAETARAGLPAGSPTGVPVDREAAAWMRRAKAHVHRSWIVPPGFRTQRLVTRVRVELDAQGNVVGDPEVIQGSGNRHYDGTALRALAKASPLPTPPASGDWTFRFDTEDLF